MVLEVKFKIALNSEVVKSPKALSRLDRRGPGAGDNLMRFKAPVAFWTSKGCPTRDLVRAERRRAWRMEDFG